MGTVYRLEHVGIGAQREKYEETVRFYETVFGWRRMREQPGILTFVGDDAGGRFEIFATDKAPLRAPHHVAFAVSLDDFDRITAELVAAGATLDAPFINDFGDRILYFTDPAENRAQIVGRIAPLDEQ